MAFDAGIDGIPMMANVLFKAVVKVVEDAGPRVRDMQGLSTLTKKFCFY